MPLFDPETGRRTGEPPRFETVVRTAEFRHSFYLQSQAHGTIGHGGRHVLTIQTVDSNSGRMTRHASLEVEQAHEWIKALQDFIEFAEK